MTQPTFSAISDLYSPTQLQRALYEAQQIAHEFLACYIEQRKPTSELMDANSRLLNAATDAEMEYVTCMKRSAPGKVSNG